MRFQVFFAQIAETLLCERCWTIGLNQGNSNSTKPCSPGSRNLGVSGPGGKIGPGGKMQYNIIVVNRSIDTMILGWSTNGDLPPGVHFTD